MIFFRIIFFIVLVLHVNLGIAQNKPSAKISVEKNRVLIGEPIKLTLEISIDTGGTVRFPLIDTIPHFEIVGQPSLDKTIDGNILNIKEVYTITSFDSGHWVIPSWKLGKIKTDTIPVDVVYTDDFDPQADYHDIKDILEVEVAKKQFPWWWYAAGGAALIAVIIYLVKRKKPVRTVVPKITVDPYDAAMKELEQLRRNKPDSKIYYSKLTDIFRLYLFRKKGILSLQKTTDDLVVQLKSLDLDKEQFDKLSQSLRLSDFVKFAKYVPAEEDDKNIFRDIENAINTIEKPVAS